MGSQARGRGQAAYANPVSSHGRADLLVFFIGLKARKLRVSHGDPVTRTTRRQRKPPSGFRWLQRAPAYFFKSIFVLFVTETRYALLCRQLLRKKQRGTC